MNRDELGEAIYQLSQAANASAAAAVLQSYPGLTTPAIDEQLTAVIAIQYAQQNITSVCLFTAVRGFVRRYKATGRLDAPLWSLAAHSPLAHLLALDEASAVDEELKWGKLALQDVDAQTEPALYGLVQYRLGLSCLMQTEANDASAFEPGIRHLAAAVLTLSPLTDENSRSLNGRAHHNLAKLYLSQPGVNRSQNVEKALNLLVKAQSLLPPDSPEMINLLILEGNAYLERTWEERLFSIKKSIQSYKTAYRLALKLSQKSRLHEIEHNLAVAYRVRHDGRRTDNYETALDYAQQALQRIDHTTMREAWAKTTLEKATILAHREQGNRLDNLEKAIALARQTLTYYQPDTHPGQWAHVHLTLGNLYCDRLKGEKRKNYQKALKYFNVVKDLRDPKINPIGWSEALNNMGTAYAGQVKRPYDTHYRQAMHCYQQALDSLQQALDVHDPHELPEHTRRTATNQGNLAFNYQQWDEALTAFQTALDAGQFLFESSGTQAGRQSVLVMNTNLATKAAYCLLQLTPAQPDAALRQLEQEKTHLLVEALTLRDANLAELPESQAQTIKALWQTIRELEAQMHPSVQMPTRRDDFELGDLLLQKRRDLRRTIADIRQTQPDFMKSDPAEINLAKLIPNNGAVVAPLITEEGSFAFIIPHGVQTVTAEHVIPLPQCSQRDLDALLKGWISAYLGQTRSNGWETAVTHFTQKLWPTLIQPIAAQLNDFQCQEAIIIPQGGLQLLPLHAAWYEDNGRTHYFSDDFEISYAPSLSVLALAHKQLTERNGQSALIAGINQYKKLNNLQHAVYEAEEVAETFKTPPHLLRNKEASRQSILEIAPGKNYLHLACHASFHWEDALESALYLANDQPLTLNDIMSQLNLDAMRLVTLSACETGITEFSQLPDEFIGLPAGFMQAGAPGVVNSLWMVDDNSTAILMERFYDYHLNEHLPPAAALKKAQERLRRFSPRYQEPYYWAAFTFYGT